MKKIILLIGLCWSVLLHTNWILQSIYFEPTSSLYAASAYRMKNGKQKLTYLDKKIKAAVKKPVIMLHHRILMSSINQDALCIVIKDQKNSSLQYELYLDSQSSISINADRSKIKKVFDIPAPKDVSIFEGFYARAVLKQDGVIVSYAQQSYVESDIVLDVSIHNGTDGLMVSFNTPEA